MTEKDWKTVSESILFSDISISQAKALCDCLGCFFRQYKKGAAIIRQGEAVPFAGILLSGSVLAESVHIDGTRNVHAILRTGQVFGDAMMSAGGIESPVTVYAHSDCTVLMIPGERIMGGCEKNCAAHTQLRRNLQKEIAEKYWTLNRRISYLCGRTLRQKISAYLYDCALDSGQKSVPAYITVPYSREQLAAYLGANRSALCRELSAMQQEGLLSYRKNRFTLYEYHAL